MIDEEATFKKFGYYSWDLTAGSDKKVIAKCERCGNTRQVRKRTCNPLLCMSCVRKGRIVSEETRRKMSRIRKGNKNSNWRGGKIKCTCLVCGKEFHVDPYKIKQGYGIFCSHKCHGVYESETSKGENNPNWQGGISFGKYCPKFNDEFKEYIRDKFGRVCFQCGKTEEENGRRLSVHHVNYDKNCGCAETEEDKKVDDGTCQFIPLCISCNVQANYDRDKWEIFFKNKLRNKLNGWYI